MKKMKFGAENRIFFGKKCDISKTVKYINKHVDGFGDYLEQNHSRKQKVKSCISFKNSKQKNERKGFYQKR